MPARSLGQLLGEIRLTKNPWFETETLPAVRRRIADVVATIDTTSHDNSAR